MTALDEEMYIVEQVPLEGSKCSKRGCTRTGAHSVSTTHGPNAGKKKKYCTVHLEDWFEEVTAVVGEERAHASVD